MSFVSNGNNKYKFTVKCKVGASGGTHTVTRYFAATLSNKEQNKSVTTNIVGVNNLNSNGDEITLEFLITGENINSYNIGDGDTIHCNLHMCNSATDSSVITYSIGFNVQAITLYAESSAASIGMFPCSVYYVRNSIS